MDIQMPVMDGIAATMAIRQRFDATQLPVIAMTAHALEEERRRCMDAGMSDFITKPIAPAELFRVLGRSWSALPDARTVRDQPLQPMSSEPGNSRLDLATAAEYALGDPARLRKMLNSFVTNQRGTADELRGFVAEGQREAAQRIAHNVKGSARYAGAMALSDLAAEGEAAIKANRPDWQELGLKLATELDAVLADVDAYLLQTEINT
jgi:two-component system sensor histidine kinase/response regulator